MKRSRRRRALPPYVVEDVAQATGQVRLYYRGPVDGAAERRKRTKIRIWASVEEEGFWPAYEAAKRGERLPKPRKERRSFDVPASETFAGLCQGYFKSAAFAQLTETTQRTRRGILKHCCAAPINEVEAAIENGVIVGVKEGGLIVGGTPIAVFGPRHVKWLMDLKAGAPEAANNRLKAVRAVFAWHIEGVENARNPCSGVKKLQPDNAEGFHTWTLAEVEQYEAKHPIGTMARVALDLARFTTHRKSDVARLGPQHVFFRDALAWLGLQQRKTRKVKSTRGIVEIPIIEPLLVSLAARPVIRPVGEAEAFLMTSFGKPYTANGLGNAFRSWCDEADLPHCTMHGLRKATASQFAELGINEDGIGAVTGHAPGSRELSRYTRSARKRVLASKAFQVLQDSLAKCAEDRATAVSTEPEWSHFLRSATKNGTISEGKSHG